MARYTIDRFEGDGWAVLEDDQARTFSIPRRWLPSQAREGDVLQVSEQPATDGHALTIRVNPSARKQQQRAVDRLRDGLSRGPKGDVEL